MTFAQFVVAALVATHASVALASPQDPRSGREGRREASQAAPRNPKASAAKPQAQPVDLAALQVQVTLDRAGFSPGALDGRMGPNTRKAQAAYEQKGGAAAQAPVEPLTTYTITDQDAAGPFAPAIPKDLVEQAQLPALTYTSTLEALAERFHATPALLQALNPGAQFAAGEQVQVPNVEPFVAPVEKPEIAPEAQAAAKKGGTNQTTGTAGRRGSTPKQPNTIAQRPDVVVTVSRGSSVLTVRDGSGQIVFYAPVTTGSEHDPLPIGEWKVNGVQFNPVFNYNPELFWDADPSHAKAKIPAGPNNPVGLVWIDLSKEHYGIHGTPEPAAIGRSESHGCVRLTNWDALKLAGMVKPGTKVIFAE